MVRTAFRQEFRSRGSRCASGTYIVGQHAVARRRVDGIGNHADDLVARLAVRNPMRSVWPIGCRPGRYRRTNASLTMATSGLPTRSRVVEVSAAQQRYAHRLEPARRGGVAPERGSRAVLRSIGPSPTPTLLVPSRRRSAAAPGERMPTSRLAPPPPRREGARHARPRSASAACHSPAGSTATTSSGSGTKPSGSWLSDANVRRKSPAAMTRIERHGDLRDDERAAHGEAAVARDGSTGVLERLTRRDALQSDHGRDAGADRTTGTARPT